jgi:HEAT repeat protein
MLKFYYQVVINGIGQAYLDAEQELIVQGDDAVLFLQGQLQDATPLAKSIIQVLLQRIAENQTFQDCLEFFDETEREIAPTVKGAPSPEWVASMLMQKYGDKVSSLLGVYLIKLERVWPFWKTVGVIRYLGKLNSRAAADTLIEFVAITPSETYRKFAVESLVAVGDASVLNKLETKLKPIEAARDALQQATEQIREKLND